MPSYKIEFDSLEWQPLHPGARAKIHREGSRQIRLIEFTPEFVEPEWCEKGHSGYILSGELEVEFYDEVVVYPQGSGLSIPPGSRSAHKARSRTPVTRLILFEDI